VSKNYNCNVGKKSVVKGVILKDIRCKKCQIKLALQYWH